MARKNLRPDPHRSTRTCQRGRIYTRLRLEALEERRLLVASPVVVSIDPVETGPTAASIVHYTVQFNEAVTGVDKTDFTVLVAGNLSGASVDSVQSLGLTEDQYEIYINSGIGSTGTVRLKLINDGSIAAAADPSKVLGGDSTAQTPITIDRAAPQVVSINRVEPGQTAAATVHFAVTFNEPVQNVDTGDFALAAAGLTGDAIAGITGSGAAYTVTVTTGSGSGSLGLNLVDNSTITDNAGNPLFVTPPGVFPGQIYTVDTLTPQVISINRADPDPTNLGTVHFTVTFNEAVSGVDLLDFKLPTQGITGAAINSISPAVPSNTYTVTIATGTGSGTLELDLFDNGTIVNAIGTHLLLDVGHPGLGQAFTIDKVPPTVSSITLADASPTNSASVHYNVQFSEIVTGVDASDFIMVADPAIIGTSFTSVTDTGDGRNYLVTINTGIAGTGNIKLSLLDNDSIKDHAGNALGGTGAGNGNAGPYTYQIDHTPPQVSSITQTDAPTTSSSTVHYSVVFSEPVSGVRTSDFSLMTANGLVGTSVTGVSPSGSSTTFTITVNTGSGSGDLTLHVVNNGSIVDAVGNSLGGGVSSGPTYTIDRTPPSVQSIMLADPNPTSANTVHFNLTFSESVTGGDFASFQLIQAGGLAGSTITDVTGNGASYVVTVNVGTGSGTLHLNLLDDDSITDLYGNLLGGLGSGNGNYLGGDTYTIDRSAPFVALIAPTDSNPTKASSVNFAVLFTEPVSGVAVADFVLDTSGVSGASITQLSGSGAAYTVTVNTGTGSGTLGLDLIDDDSIHDLQNRPLGRTGLGNGNFTGQPYTIDRIPPFVQSISLGSTPTNLSAVDFVVTFNESVAVVIASDFNLVTSGTLAGTAITNITGSGKTYDVTVSTGTGGGALELDFIDDDSIQDLSGNVLGGPGAHNGDLTGPAYIVDKVAPSVVSIALADASPTAASTVHYNVTFSKGVSGVDASDFALVAVNTSGAFISGVSGVDNNYIVTVSVGTGNGTLGLNLVDDDSITDDAGNPVGGTGAGNGNKVGAVYTIDKGTPAVTSIVPADPNPTVASIVHYTVTFSDTVTGVNAADFNLTSAATLHGAAITDVSGAGAVYNVSVDTGTGNGTLQLNLVDNDSIKDVLNQPLGGAGVGNGNFAGGAYAINRVVPPVPTPWRNPQLPLDVNHDGVVEPRDAVAVINKLLIGGIQPLAAPGSGQTPDLYYDTNGDNLLSPADALKIITRLLTPPVVTIDTLSPFTVDVTPQITVRLSSPAGVPDGTPVSVDIDLNNDGLFNGPGEAGRAHGTMFNGVATFDITPAFAPDNPAIGPYQVNLQAHVQDRDGLPGTSAPVPLIIDTMSSDALKNYVDTFDPTYTYSLTTSITDPGGRWVDYILDMKSQTWRSSDDVNKTVWQHWMQVVVPTGAIGTTALLLIDGGSTSATPPTSPNDALVAEALLSHTVVVDLPDIPNEPLTFTGDPNNPRSEDAIIAYSFNQYMDNIGAPGNDTWPVLEAMVKAVVRGMDTVQSFVPTVAGDSPINDFVITGYSKRGWTTWLTAAVDDRIRAIIPGVFDNLNQGPQMVHHYGAYGFFSPAVQDYTDLNIFGRILTPEGEQLSEIVDPYRYLDNGHFNIPKLMIDSAGDQFFVSDSAQFYIHDLPGTENYIRYLPNTDHKLDSRANDSTATFYNAIINNLPLPQFSWDVEPNGSIRVRTIDTPSQVLLWQITNPTARDFRQDYIPSTLVWTSSELGSEGSGVYVASLPMPATGATAFFVELTFPSPIPGNPYVFTTEIHVNTLLPLYPWPYPSGIELPTSASGVDLNAAASALAASTSAPALAAAAASTPAPLPTASTSAAAASLPTTSRSSESADTNDEDAWNDADIDPAAVDLVLAADTDDLIG